VGTHDRVVGVARSIPPRPRLPPRPAHRPPPRSAPITVFLPPTEPPCTTSFHCPYRSPARPATATPGFASPNRMPLRTRPYPATAHPAPRGGGPRWAGNQAHRDSPSRLNFGRSPRFPNSKPSTHDRRYKPNLIKDPGDTLAHMTLEDGVTSFILRLDDPDTLHASPPKRSPPCAITFARDANNALSLIAPAVQRSWCNPITPPNHSQPTYPNTT